MSNSSRRFGRFQVNLAGACDVNGQTHPISILNLSVGGCFFSFSNPNQDEDALKKSLSIEDEIDLMIQLDTPKHTLTTQCKVAWIDLKEGYGCSFKRLKPLDVWSIIQSTRSLGTAFHIEVGEQIDQTID